MTQEILTALLDYIDARIAEKTAAYREDGDGGLIESLVTMELKETLFSLLTTPHHNAT